MCREVQVLNSPPDRDNGRHRVPNRRTDPTTPGGFPCHVLACLTNEFPPPDLIHPASNAEPAESDPQRWKPAMLETPVGFVNESQAVPAEEKHAKTAATTAIPGSSTQHRLQHITWRLAILQWLHRISGTSL